jgi:hypothetical protein
MCLPTHKLITAVKALLATQPKQKRVRSIFANRPNQAQIKLFPSYLMNEKTTFVFKAERTIRAEHNE